MPTVSLVFLHGLGQHSGQYHRFAGAMTASGGIDVWAIDHTGHGLSEGDPGVGGAPLSDLAADAAALADIALAELPEVPQAVMGHSLGAVTALTMLAHRDHDFAPQCCAAFRAVRSSNTVGGTLRRGIPVLVVHGTDDRIAPGRSRPGLGADAAQRRDARVRGRRSRPAAREGSRQCHQRQP